MDTLIAPVAAAVALAAAATMGFAIQRGATCTVAAVDELVGRRGWGRLRAMLEASLWVATGLLLARRLHWVALTPPGFALTAWTALGAALLGLGAYVNRACVFGAIARLGNGDWAYLATPLGFYLGCLSVQQLFTPPQAQALAQGSWLLAMDQWAIWPLGLFVLGRLSAPWLLRSRPAPAAARLWWSPTNATVVIGITFLITLLLAGAWAYTDLLAALAQRMAGKLWLRSGLALALLGGAMLGGWMDGRLRRVAPTLPGLARCLLGGALMGWGSLLIPGSNDGLILLGMPLLWPYAWVAFATMCASIATAMLLAQWHEGNRRGSPRHHAHHG
jgi:toxin CptA